MYVSKSDLAAEKLDLQTADASDRLASLKEAQAECLAAIMVAVDRFIIAIDDYRNDGKYVVKIDREECRTSLDDVLDTLAYDARSDLNDMECAEGNYTPDDGEEDWDRIRDQEIDDKLTGDA